MWRSVLQFLVCPRCSGVVRLANATDSDQQIATGSLSCVNCDASYPIVRGVPRLLAQTENVDLQTTIDRFGWQWNHFTNLLSLDQQSAQFLDWVAPLGEQDFAGKVVLDAGCGMGRMTEAAARFGPAHLLAVDASSSVDVAYERLRGHRNVHVIQADLLALPLRRGDDAQVELAYTIGVLHHLPRPEHGFRCILETLVPEGRQFGWVYGAEGNGWIRTLVDPARTLLTSHLDPRVLLGLSQAVATPVHTVARLVNRLGGERRMPYGEYLSWLGRWPFRHSVHVVYDHLTPKIAHYIPRREIEDWFKSAPVRVIDVSARNSNSWRFLVQRSSEK